MENLLVFSYNIGESNIMFWLKARRENSMKKFNREDNRHFYSNYQVYFKMLCAQVNVLAWAVKEDRKTFIRINAERLIQLSCQFDGYIECLFDLGIVSESDYDRFFDFTKQIRYDSKEILIYLDSTI